MYTVDGGKVWLRLSTRAAEHGRDGFADATIVDTRLLNLWRAESVRMFKITLPSVDFGPYEFQLRAPAEA